MYYYNILKLSKEDKPVGRDLSQPGIVVAYIPLLTFSPYLIRDKDMNKIFFILIHLACLLVIWCGISPAAVVICGLLYFIRMFAITAGYHRLFSHHSYKTSRVFQFMLAVLGASAAQKGPIWWAGSHRRHHKYADTPKDLHSPRINGFWWSHVGWILSKRFDEVDSTLVKDLAAFPFAATSS